MGQDGRGAPVLAECRAVLSALRILAISGANTEDDDVRPPFPAPLYRTGISLKIERLEHGDVNEAKEGAGDREGYGRSATAGKPPRRRLKHRAREPVLWGAAAAGSELPQTEVVPATKLAPPAMPGVLSSFSLAGPRRPVPMGEAPAADIRWRGGARINDKGRSITRPGPYPWRISTRKACLKLSAGRQKRHALVRPVWELANATRGPGASVDRGSGGVTMLRRPCSARNAAAFPR